MEGQHLGDSLDFWKRSILQIIRNKKYRLWLVPLVSDGRRWNKKQLTTYKSILNEKIHPASANRFQHVKRGTYLGGLGGRKGGLFLDPTTGIWKNRKQQNKHLAIGEITNLCANDRLVLVYDQSWPHMKKKKFKKEVKKYLRQRNRPIRYYWAAWVSFPVVMWFVSAEQNRIQKIVATVKKTLGKAFVINNLYF